ncbi:MAG: hypothetical protein AAFR88_04955 [Pseudomonadota bacterium]
MKAEGDELNLPPNPAKYLTDWLFEIGPTSGDNAITWPDLTAWQEISGVVLSAWEAKTLRSLSVALLAERSRAKQPDAIPPYTDEPEQARNARVTRQFARMFDAFSPPKEQI